MKDFTPIADNELADVRRILAEKSDAAFFPRAIVEGLLGKLDLLAPDGEPDDLDAFVRQQLAADPEFRREYARLHAVALLRSARRLHESYRTTGDEVDYCAHCSRLAGYPKPAPCETIAAIGGQDEFDMLLDASSLGSPQARAIREMSPEQLEAHIAYALMNGGVPIDLKRIHADRDGVRWMCQGVFQFFDSERSQIPVMVSLDHHGQPLTLGSLLQGRGPITPVDGGDEDRSTAYANMMRNVRRMLLLPVERR